MRYTPKAMAFFCGALLMIGGVPTVAAADANTEEACMVVGANGEAVIDVGPGASAVCANWLATQPGSYPTNRFMDTVGCVLRNSSGRQEIIGAEFGNPGVGTLRTWCDGFVNANGAVGTASSPATLAPVYT